MQNFKIPSPTPTPKLLLARPHEKSDHTGASILKYSSPFDGDFPAVQWPGLHTPNAGGPGLNLVPGNLAPWSGNKISHAATKGLHATTKGLHATTKSSNAATKKRPCSATKDPACCN